MTSPLLSFACQWPLRTDCLQSNDACFGNHTLSIKHLFMGGRSDTKSWYLSVIYKGRMAVTLQRINLCFPNHKDCALLNKCSWKGQWSHRKEQSGRYTSGTGSKVPSASLACGLASPPLPPHVQAWLPGRYKMKHKMEGAETDPRETYN